jgi:hypothetical protein
MSYKIYAYERNTNARKAMIVGNYGGVSVAFPPGFRMVSCVDDEKRV